MIAKILAKFGYYKAKEISAEEVKAANGNITFTAWNGKQRYFQNVSNVILTRR